MQEEFSESKVSDIKNLDKKGLTDLCTDIREEIISTVRKNGGHLSSNLGIVETTVALYKTFNFPSDKLIFDVGHQCYAHKILSKRVGFDTIRTDGGISGFPDREESEYDAFGAGHAGTSLSAALGLCEARDKLNGKETVIAIVGDGAIGNGLNLEALTSKKEKPKNLIVILNDNGMSISKNKNGFYQYISKKTTKGSYVKSKYALKKVFGNSLITRIFKRIRDFFKRIISRNDYFEKFGFKYVGIVDGNDIGELVKILNRVKNVAKYRAVLLHVKTTKGKGLCEAEEHPDSFHGVGKKLLSSCGGFAVALGDTLNSLIEKDDKIVAIAAGMKDGTGLFKVEEKFPNNFYDVGIAEEYAVTFAAGLAAGGLKPVVAIYSTFMQRAYDQVLHDVCIQNLPVVFCMDRAGFVGEDGKTHQGLFDLSFLSHLPNLTILAPNGKEELKDAISYALSLSKPVAIRYPKECGEDYNEPISKFPFATICTGNSNITIISVGPKMKNLALDLKDELDATVISARIIKPLDNSVLDNIKDGSIVITLEENSVIGGFGALVKNYMQDRNVKVLTFGAKDKFVSHGTISEQLKTCGLSKENILLEISKMQKI